MKTWFLILPGIFLLLPLSAQDNPYGEPVMSKKELRNMVKEKRIADRLAEEERMIKLTEELVSSQQFVLEADFIAGKSGTRQAVNSLLNFIVVDSLDGMLQIGSNWGVGYNGVGGITVDGSITKYEVSKKTTKRGTTFNIEMHLMSALGNYDIHFWITSTGNTEATVRGMYSGSLTYSGQIVPLNEARVYKGSSF
ncbi:MAG: DUF4251 domain-containing protein [Bacteroidales bacterium]|nr:DUF4251 domain-containing protein [Bacteroidales bacterium]